MDSVPGKSKGKGKVVPVLLFNYAPHHQDSIMHS
jgi:hypothetical protein